MRPSPPGEEALSLFPQVNVCHTAIMVSFDHTEDPQLEGRRMRTRSAAAQAQRRQEPPEGTGREQAGRGPGPCGPSDPPPGPDARGQVRPVLRTPPSSASTARGPSALPVGGDTPVARSPRHRPPAGTVPSPPPVSLNTPGVHLTHHGRRHGRHSRHRQKKPF